MKQLSKNIKIFNKKNGLNFSLSEYKGAISKAIKAASASGVEVDEVAIQHQVYKDTVKSLYRQIALNACKVLDADDEILDNEEVINEKVNEQKEANPNDSFLEDLRNMRKNALDDSEIIGGDGLDDSRMDIEDQIKAKKEETRMDQIRRREAEKERQRIDYNVELDEDLLDDKLLEEFETRIICIYRKTKEGSSFLLGDPYDDLNQVEKYQVINDAVKDFIDNPVSLYEELYRTGRIGIRDMRNYVNKITQGEFTGDQMAKGFQFVQALKQVNQSRSFFWKVFHPFRNNAEQRDAAKMEAMITQRIIESKEVLDTDDSDLTYEALGSTDEERNKALVESYKNYAKKYSPLGEAYEDLNDNLEASKNDLQSGQDQLDYEQSESSFSQEKENISVNLGEKETTETSRFIESNSIDNPTRISNV